MAYRWSGLVILLCWSSLWVCRTRWSPEKAYLSLLLYFCAVNWSSLCRTHRHVASTPSIDSLLLASIMALEAYHSEQVESVCWVDFMMIGIRWIGTSQCPCGMGCPVITPNDRAINSMEMMMLFIQVLECLLSQVLTVLFPFHPKSGKRFFSLRIWRVGVSLLLFLISWESICTPICVLFSLFITIQRSFLNDVQLSCSSVHLLSISLYNVRMTFVCHSNLDHPLCYPHVMATESASNDFYNSYAFIQECLNRKHNVNAESAKEWGYHEGLGPLNRSRFMELADANKDETKRKQQECFSRVYIHSSRYISSSTLLSWASSCTLRVSILFWLKSSFSYEECCMLPPFCLRFLW